MTARRPRRSHGCASHPPEEPHHAGQGRGGYPRSTTTCRTTRVDAEQSVVITTFNDMGIRSMTGARCRDLLLSDAARPQGRRCRSRGTGRTGAIHRRLGIRPYHRPGAHVHARNGLSRAADARRRNRNRQAHRRRPQAHDQAISACPTTIAEILEWPARSRGRNAHRRVD